MTHDSIRSRSFTNIIDGSLYGLERGYRAPDAQIPFDDYDPTRDAVKRTVWDRVRALLATGPVSTPDLAMGLGWSPDRTTQFMRRRRDAGLVTAVRGRGAGTAFMWSLVERP